MVVALRFGARSMIEKYLCRPCRHALWLQYLFSTGNPALWKSAHPLSLEVQWNQYSERHQCLPDFEQCDACRRRNLFGGINERFRLRDQLERNSYCHRANLCRRFNEFNILVDGRGGCFGQCEWKQWNTLQRHIVHQRNSRASVQLRWS